jgi:hypothetical protein
LTNFLKGEFKSQMQLFDGSNINKILIYSKKKKDLKPAMDKGKNHFLLSVNKI